MTTINTRKDARELYNAIEAFAKRSKAITIKRTYWGCEYARIDVTVTKTTGKVYREMVEYLNSILPYNYQDEGEWASAWWHSYNDTLIDPFVEGKWEATVCVSTW